MRKRTIALLFAVAMPLMFAGCGSLADFKNDVQLTPQTPTIKAGGKIPFQIALPNISQQNSIVWLVNNIQGGNATVGTIVSTGTYTASYTAPVTAPKPNTVTVAVGEIVTSGGTTLSVLDSTVVTITSSVTLTPSATIGVSPNQIAQGSCDQNSNNGPTLSWSSANVNSCTIDTIIGGSTVNTINAGTSGSMNVCQSETTTYALNCTGGNGSASAQTTLTVQPTNSGISVAITLTSNTIQSGQSMPVTATVTNDPANLGVTWSTTAGTITPSPTNSLNATFTAPVVQQGQSNETVTITATSVADVTAFANATITVTPGSSTSNQCTAYPPPILNVNPGNPTVVPGATVQFTVNLQSGTLSNLAVTWSLTPGEGVTDPGTIDPNTGLYQAPTDVTLATAKIIATSVECTNIIAYDTVLVSVPTTTNGN